MPPIPKQTMDHSLDQTVDTFISLFYQFSPTCLLAVNLFTSSDIYEFCNVKGETWEYIPLNTNHGLTSICFRNQSTFLSQLVLYLSKDTAQFYNVM